MIKKEILEGNKLIAGFYYENSFYDDGEDCYCKNEDNSYIKFYIEDAKYHKSWDWLMPVIEEIENDYSCSVSITYDECYITNERQTFEKSFQGKTKLEACYKGVVSFIKYYNKNNK